MFPKDIRVVGKYYKVPDSDMHLTSKGGNSHSSSSYYYTIKRSNIVVMTDQEKHAFLNPPAPTILTPNKIYDAGDCVVCLSITTSITFIPCGHRCVCATCNVTLKQTGYKCPVCREKITQDING
jgi:hypothetical protein